MYLACHQYTIHSLFLFILRLIGTNQCASSVFNRNLNDSINDTVDERSRHLSRRIFTNFCLAKLQDGKLFRHCAVRSTFSFDSRLVYEYLPYASTKTADKSKVC